MVFTKEMQAALRADGNKLRQLTGEDHGPFFMPDDLVVVLNLDADEAGDYRVMPHCEAVNNPNWTIMPDMVPSDLD